jgi:hypothetical protein
MRACRRPINVHDQMELRQLTFPFALHILFATVTASRASDSSITRKFYISLRYTGQKSTAKTSP